MASKTRKNRAGSPTYQPMSWNEEHTELVPNGKPLNRQDEINAAAKGTGVYEIIDRVLRGAADLDTSIDWQDEDFTGAPEYLSDAHEIAMRKPTAAQVKALEAEIQALKEAKQQEVAKEEQKKADDDLVAKIRNILSEMKEEK